MDEEQQPLLQSQAHLQRVQSVNVQSWFKIPSLGFEHVSQTSREKAIWFLSSKAGHYTVLSLVTIDTLCIISGKLITLDHRFKLMKNTKTLSSGCSYVKSHTILLC